MEIVKLGYLGRHHVILKKKKKKAGKGLFSNLFQIPSQFEIRRKANAFESSCMFVMLVMQ